MSEQQAKPNGSTGLTAGGGIKDSVLKILLGGTGGGAGVAIVYFAYDLLRQKPELFGELLQSWGPGFVYVMAFMWIGHGYVKQQSRFAERQLTVAQDTAAANARLASAVEKVASRDNDHLLLMKGLMEETGDRTRRIVSWIENEERRREEAERVKREAISG